MPPNFRSCCRFRSSLFGPKGGAALLASACGLFPLIPDAHGAAEVVKLNQSLAENESVLSDFAISPDGTRVVYRAGKITAPDELIELFVVSVMGGTPVKLNGEIVEGGEGLHLGGESFRITPDGSNVVYRADLETAGVSELFAVPIDGGPSTKLNGEIVEGGFLFFPSISPDGIHVVYLGSQDTAGVDELYSVPIRGGTPVKLNANLVEGGEVFDYQVSPDGSKVVYAADQDVDGVSELYSVAIEGGDEPTKLNGTIPPGGGVLGGGQVSPDGSRVLYLALEDSFERELYSVPIGGGSSQKLNGSLVTGGGVIDFEISADGGRVVYFADEDTLNVYELYSVPFTGSSPVKLNSAPPPPQTTYQWELSPDGFHVVYQDPGLEALYSVPIGGGIQVRLNSDLGPLDQVNTFRIDSNSGTVVYRAEPDGLNLDDLFSVPLLGGTPVMLNQDLPPDRRVLNSPEFQISPDGGRVIYAANPTAPGLRELFMVPTGGGTPVRLNGDLSGTSGVAGVVISPDSRSVVYQAWGSGFTRDIYSSTVRSEWRASGGDWNNPANWDIGQLPSTLLPAVIDTPAVVTMSGGFAPRTVDSLRLGGGSGPSVLELLNDASLTALHGIEMSAGGVLRGDGVISTNGLGLTIPVGAELRAASGDRLRVSANAIANSGRVDVTGVAANPAELETNGLFINAIGTGFLAAHDARLRFGGELLNFGTLSLTGGFNDLFGDIDNPASGRIIVSGGATAVFYDDVINTGSINASASGPLQSVAIFFGAFSGNGVSGGGHVFLEGDASPGASPGTMAFGGSVSYGSFATLQAEIGGTAPGSGYDRLTVAGNLSLDGALEVSLISPFVPSAGDAFDLWDAGAVTGGFHTVSLPPLPAGLFWNASGVNTTGVLSVALVPESYAAFAAYHALTTAPDGDEEGDGLPNLIEYVLALDPNSADDPGAQPAFSQAGGKDIFEFSMASPAGSDVVMAIESSTDLDNWAVEATRAFDGTWSGVTPVALLPDIAGKIRIRLERPTGGNVRRFYRLRGTLP